MYCERRRRRRTWGIPNIYTYLIGDREALLDRRNLVLRGEREREREFARE